MSRALIIGAGAAGALWRDHVRPVPNQAIHGGRMLGELHLIIPCGDCGGVGWKHWRGDTITLRPRSPR